MTCGSRGWACEKIVISFKAPSSCDILLDFPGSIALSMEFELSRSKFYTAKVTAVLKRTKLRKHDHDSPLQFTHAHWGETRDFDEAPSFDINEAVNERCDNCESVAVTLGRIHHVV